MNTLVQFEQLSLKQQTQVFTDAYADVIPMAPFGAVVVPAIIFTLTFASGLLQTETAISIGFLAIASAVAAARLAHVRTGLEQTQVDPQRFRRTFSTLLILAGIVWAAFSTWAAVTASEQWFSYLILTISISASSVAAFAFGPIPRTGFTYACLWLVPIAGVFLIDGTYAGAVTASLCVPYIFLVHTALKRASRRLWSNLIQREQLLEIANQLERTHTQSEVASQAKSAFLATMSHDFRLPVHAMLGFSEILRRQFGDGEEMEVIDDATDQLQRLIDRVVQFTTLDDLGATPSEPEPCQVREVATQFLFQLNRDKPANVTIDVDDRVPQWVTIDPQALRTLLKELVGNAVKFSRGAHVQVLLDHREAPLPMLIVQVDDLGPGIPKDQQDQIFEPFTQIHNTPGQKTQGAGIGLALCQSAAAAANGTVQLLRTGVSGSLFQATLPAPRWLNPARQDTPLAAQKVLVVDDSIINRMVALRMLQGLGFEVAEAPGGQEAVDLANRESFSAILMDCQMPLMDGYEATRRIRQPGGLCHDTPILALTADGLPGAKKRCLEAGMDGYVIKPAGASQLRNSLRQLGVYSVA